MNAALTPALALLLPAALLAAAEEPARISAAAERELQELERNYLDVRARELIKAKAGDFRRVIYSEHRDLVYAFRHKGDARAVSALHITLLELACEAGREGLIRELLAAGAVPQGRGAHSELKELCFCNELDNAARLRCINMLAAAGARAEGEDGAACLSIISLGAEEGDEDILLRLMELGADPFEPDAAKYNPPLDFVCRAMAGGWTRILERLMTRELPSGWESCRQYGIPGLMSLASDINKLPAGSPEWEYKAQALLLLLRHGANVHALFDCHEQGTQELSVADTIHQCPPLLDWLRAQGVEVPRTPRRLRRENLAADLASLRTRGATRTDQHPPMETLQALYEDMARLAATPQQPMPEEKRDRAFYEQLHARGHAFMLMWQVDAARTAGILAALPEWEEPDGPALLHTMLRYCRSVQLPAETVIRRATAYAEAGQALDAYEHLHLLLGRDASNHALIDTLCTNAHPALAAAACRLRLELRLKGEPLLPPLKPDAPAARLRCARILNERLNLNLDRPAHYIIRSFVNALPTCQPPDAEEILALLREEGEQKAASYLRQILTEWRLLHGQEDGSTATRLRLFVVRWQQLRRGLAPTERRSLHQERLAALLRPERVAALAIAIELAVSRWIWEHFDDIHPQQKQSS